MLTILALLSALGPSTPSAGAPDASPPVRVWMNNDRRFHQGDRVRVQVDTDADGYLLVLNFDPDGRIRVLFPLDPRDDAMVRAGHRYEVRSDNREEAFRAGGDGTGLIYTAISAEPWRFSEIVLADRWDYTRLEIDPGSTNPEADLSDLVQRIAGEGGFDYDVLGYRVYGESTYGYNNMAYPGNTVYVYDDYLFCNNWNWRYNGCRRYPFDGGWAFGAGYYGYDSYFYNNRYRTSGYGYGGGYGGGYNYPSSPRYPTGRTPVVVGRSRGYTVRPRSSLPGWNSRTGNRVIVPDRIGVGDPVPPARRGGYGRPSNPGSRNGGNGGNGGDGANRGNGAGRGGEAGRGGSPSYGPRSRPEPSRRDPPPARSNPNHGNGGGGASAPPKGGGGGGGRPAPSAPSRPRGGRPPR